MTKRLEALIIQLVVRFRWDLFEISGEMLLVIANYVSCEHGIVFPQSMKLHARERGLVSLDCPTVKKV